MIGSSILNRPLIANGYPYYTFLWIENTTTKKKPKKSEKYKFNKRIQKQSSAHVDYLAGLVCLHAGL